MRYRVRVHAFGQVVAFDIPLSLLKEESDGNCIMPQQTTQLLRDALSTLNSYVSTTKEIEWDASDNTRIVDQWQIRRAITTRLPRDIAIRSVREYGLVQIHLKREKASAAKHIHTSCDSVIYLRIAAVRICNQWIVTICNNATQELQMNHELILSAMRGRIF